MSSGIQPIAFLDAVAGYSRSTTDGSADRPIKLAVVDPAYDGFAGLYPSSVNPARVTFEGETTLSAKAYPVASGYMPSAGDRVYMVPIGTTYLIAGSVGNYAAQGFYAHGTNTGVEFGEGSYFDTGAGLHLETDAYVAGDVSLGGFLDVGSRNLRIPEFQFGGGNIVGPGAGTSITVTVTYPIPWPASTPVYVITQMTGSAGASAFSSLRTQNKTNTNFQVVVLKTDAARANYDATSTIAYDWVAIAKPPTP